MQRFVLAASLVGILAAAPVAILSAVPAMGGTEAVPRVALPWLPSEEILIAPALEPASEDFELPEILSHEDVALFPARKERLR